MILFCLLVIFFFLSSFSFSFFLDLNFLLLLWPLFISLILDFRVECFILDVEFYCEALPCEFCRQSDILWAYQKGFLMIKWMFNIRVGVIIESIRALTTPRKLRFGLVYQLVVMSNDIALSII